jgi:exoribonuclease R
MTTKFIFTPEDRNYSVWNNSENLTNPFDSKLFAGDCYSIDTTTNAVTIHSSEVRNMKAIPCVLILAGNKTYGRHNKNNKLLYRCVPDNKLIPPFLVPYEIKSVGFSKVFVNMYVTVSFFDWTGKHPLAVIGQTIGPVDVVVNFYEYQLCCKGLNTSIQKFQKATTHSLTLRGQKLFEACTVAHSEDFAPLFPKVDKVDRQDLNVFSIDPDNCVDFDDAFGIRDLGGGVTCISIYISNVTLVLDKLKLWPEFAGRVSTIYLPDKKRTMLPAVLSDDLCSLCAGQVRIALFMDIYLTDDGIDKIEYGNAFVKLRRNFCYEEPDLLIDPDYAQLLRLCRWLTPKYKYMDSIDDSHDVVSYLMILMNYYCAKELLAAKTGIFRSSSVTRDVIVPVSVPAEVGKFIKIFNSSRSQYVTSSANTQHEMLNLEAYIHITSPIRRLVDLLNMIEFQKIKGLAVLSDEAHAFYSSWIGKLDYINLTTKTIRRVQNDCDFLHLCTNNDAVMEREYDGYLFNKVYDEDLGSFQYAVFLPELKMTSRVIISDGELEFSSRRFKLFLFKNEENFKRKIRIHPLHLL